MIVVDLDGTLLNINSGCSKKTRKYLKKLKDLGYIIVIATGRLLRDAVFITDGAVFANYVISSGGAVIYDMDNRKVIQKNQIDKEEVKRICSYYNNEIKYICICDLFNYSRYKYEGDMERFYDKRIDDIDKYLADSDDVVHMFVHFYGNEFVNKYYELFNSDKLELLVMQDSFSNIKCLDIVKKGVSKYNAIKVVSGLEGISNDNIISFGDGLNDVDMIKRSGIGVAMGNALDDVKKVSDYETISHNDDGVIYFLKGYLDKNNLMD